MATAQGVANVFLKLSEPETGDVLTNLKIQKLLYYAQGFSLAIYGKPLFDEDILHWDHGPVVGDLYRELRQYGSSPVPVPEDYDPSQEFNSDQLEMISEVNNVYGQFSAWKLRDMTHTEAPWLDTSKDEVISHDALHAYFKTLINA